MDLGAINLLRLLLFLILLIPEISLAKFSWNDMGACLRNACSCNCNPSQITEYWPSVNTYNSAGELVSQRTSHKYKNNCNCPPYRKTNGRAGCIKKFNVPSAGGYRVNMCAESPGPSLIDYFNPHIRIRGQFCNAASCWTKQAVLKYDGECLNWPGPYGLPLQRVCARIALPGESKSNGVDDDGYTPGKHLDFEGYKQDDEPVYDLNGNVVIYNPPKLCAYVDPSFFQPQAISDITDINPTRQPFHTGSGLSPIAQMLIAIVDSGMPLTDVLSTVLTKMKLPHSAINIIMTIAKMPGNTLVAFLKAVGQLNRVVSSHLGCIDIALGPFPPPFCNPLVITTGAPVIEKICPTVTSDTGLCPAGVSSCVLPSTSTSPCVHSITTPNNAISNGIRIGFDEITPVCTSGVYTTDRCVSLSVTSAQTAHDLYSDMLPPNIIVNSPPLTPSPGQTGFRIVYGTRIAGVIELSDSYNQDIPDCVSTGFLNSNQCQVIYGINSGKFVDLSVTFPSIETTYNTNTLAVRTPLIIDPSGMERRFTAAIVRTPNPSDDTATSLGIVSLAVPGDQTSATSPIQTVDQICVYDVTNTNKTPTAVGCVQRAPAPEPYVYGCRGSNFVNVGNGVTMTCPFNDNNNPAMIASLTVEGSTTAGAVYVPSNNGNYAPTSINLAGNDYTAFVTDSYYNTAPFTTQGPSTSPSSGYLYGTYLGNLVPYTVNNDDVRTNNNAQYLYGLEYQNSVYSTGVGNNYITPPYQLYTCLSSDSFVPCPENIKNCVLTNLYRNDIVDCNNFNDLVSQTYSPSRMCTSSDTLCRSSAEVSCSSTASAAGICPTLKVSSSCSSNDCTYVASLPALSTAPSGVGGVSIYSCPANSATGEPLTYCYYNSTMNNICQITTDLANRIYPEQSLGATLTSSDYYNYVAPSNNSSTIINTNPDTIACAKYLGSLSTMPYSTNIMPCNSSNINCSIIEYFYSPSPSQTLTIKSCTNNVTNNSEQCYVQSSSGICQVSNLLTIRYSSDPTLPNPTISTNATESSKVANKLLTANSYTDCTSFLGAMNSLYANIAQCNNAQTQSVCPVVDTVSSTNPANTVSVQKCSSSNTTSCYVNPMGVPVDVRSFSSSYPAYTNVCSNNMMDMNCSVVMDLTSTAGVILQDCTKVTTSYCYTSTASACTLGCTGATQGPSSMSCSSYIALMSQPSDSSKNYGNIPQCSNDAVCPDPATLVVTYGSGATCSGNSSPSCTNVETVSNGGSNLFTIQNCRSSGYSVTVNSNVTAINSPSTYYCYSPANSSCNVMLSSSVTRSSSAAIPITNSTPNICPVLSSSISVTPSNTSPCSASNFNPSLCAIRTKTAIEMNLCSTLMPYPKCPATTSANISWSETDVGQISLGTCINNTVSSDPNGAAPSRYCLADTAQDNATTKWGSVTGSCLLSCGATTINGSFFTTTKPGRTATGSCIAGYLPVSSTQLPTAVCSGTSSEFVSLQNPCQISYCIGTVNGTNFPQTSPGNTATSTGCASGYVQNSNGVATAVCNANPNASSGFGTVTNPCISGICTGGTRAGATFPDTQVGNISMGTCLPGYYSVSRPSTRCNLVNNVPTSTESNPCVLLTCDASPNAPGNANTNANGRAIWYLTNSSGQISKTEFPADGKWVVGACRSNYKPFCVTNNVGIGPRRRCTIVNGVATWSDVTESGNDTGCRGNSANSCATEINFRNANSIPLVQPIQ